MPQPKVSSDKRRRTVQACDTCKRKKRKCDGLKPCNACSTRGTSCTSGERDNGSDVQPSPKRRMTDNFSSSASGPVIGSPPHNAKSPQAQHNQRQKMPQRASVPVRLSQVPVTPPQETPLMTAPAGPIALFPKSEHGKSNGTLKSTDQTFQLLPSGSTATGHEDEVIVYNYTQMVPDPNGRLLYIGDSATSSFLQLVRIIVDSVAGYSSFTADPKRHDIVENAISLPPHTRGSQLLPDKQTADVLVKSFLTNTSGLIEVFNRQSFIDTLEMCYADPLNVDPSWLCLLYLTFAIGLVMAIPAPESREDSIIRNLRSEPVNRADIFYSDAKNLRDPLAGFEDAGFWGIQASTLMSFYMLTISKRNAAYALYGMAVRSAFALGLHREETMRIFDSTEQALRRNLWRSLFVLDRFLSASLGRPTSIRESDCSGDTLTAGEEVPHFEALLPTAADAGLTYTRGLEASVRSCHVIGDILEKVYSRRKISTKLAQEIIDECRGWSKALDPSLDWRQAAFSSPLKAVAILHVNLFYLHSIVLLTRPFFLFLMHKLHQERRENGQRWQGIGTRMEKFGEACVIASCHSISLIQNALEGRYLPRRNPFVIYFLFASALVVLSNEFSTLFDNPSASASMSNALFIMNYCAGTEHEPQASRLLSILIAFRDVVAHQNALRSQSLICNTRLPSHAPSGSLLDKIADPIGDLFMAFTSAGKPSTLPKSAGLPKHFASHGSNPSISPAHPLMNLSRSSSSSKNSTNGNGPASNHSHPDMSFSFSPVSTQPHSNTRDPFFDLGGLSSSGVEGSSYFGEDEIDFEILGQWLTSEVTVLNPGDNGLAPRGR